MRILFVEDEQELARWVVKALSDSGYLVEHAATGEMAEQFLQQGEFDAMVLDLRLPGKQGMAVLRDMRARDDRTPVLILTAHDTLDDKVKGLHAGADDYLAKPFALSELEARLVALIRRSHGREHPRLQYGELVYDSAQRQFLLHGEPLSLSPREAALLNVFISRPGFLLSKHQLLDKIYSLDQDVSLDAVEVLVYRLRKKLGGSGVNVVTVRGMGYMLEKEVAA